MSSGTADATLESGRGATLAEDEEEEEGSAEVEVEDVGAVSRMTGPEFFSASPGISGPGSFSSSMVRHWKEVGEREGRGEEEEGSK
jgi:hypothetical protein